MLFIPTDDKNYEWGRGTTTTLEVLPVVVEITEAPTTDSITYSPDTTLADVKLNGGFATVDDGRTNLIGTYEWVNDSITPIHGNAGYEVVFTPRNTNYAPVKTTVLLDVQQAVPVVAPGQTASALTYGHALGESSLAGIKATVNEVNCPGTFAWVDSTIVPSVADSNITPYAVVFTPSDNTNYTSVNSEVTLTVSKAAAPVLPAMNVAYVYTQGTQAAPVSVDLLAQLPQDMGSPSFVVSVADPAGILENVDTTASGFAYQVKSTGSIGDTATITATVTSENYESCETTLTVRLTDKMTVHQQEGASVAVVGGNSLIYGQPLSTLTLNTDSAVFVADGVDLATARAADESVVVPGSLTWDTPDAILPAGTTSAAWTFTPDDQAAYSTATGTVSIEVQKAMPVVVVPTTTPSTYNSSATLNDVELLGGSATSLENGAVVDVSGAFAWAQPTLIPTCDVGEYEVIFTPTDSGNYQQVHTTSIFEVSPAASIISQVPTASPLVYGQTLADSVLSGGATSAGGSFTWTNETIAPSVVDSESTLYGVTFTPQDAVNYLPSDTHVSLVVKKALLVPNAPESEMVVDATVAKVGDIALPSGWEWDEADLGTVFASDASVQAVAHYRAKDAANYETVDMTIAIAKKAAPGDDPQDPAAPQDPSVPQDTPQDSSGSNGSATSLPVLLAATGDSLGLLAVLLFALVGSAGLVAFVVRRQHK